MPLPKPNRAEKAVERARHARKLPSAAEALAWRFLRNNRLGFKFRREYPVLDYRIDFYCPEALLGVELDGEQHDSAYDADRDARFLALGIEILRIPNREFFMLDKGPCPEPFALILGRCEERTGRKGNEL